MTTERIEGDGEIVLSIDQLREFRRQNRISQEELARKLGIERGILSAIERRKAYPTVPLDEFREQYLRAMEQVFDDKIQGLIDSRNRIN